MNEKYNGWTNYATWRIHLEIWDGYETEHEMLDCQVKAYELSEMTGEDFIEYVREVIDF